MNTKKKDKNVILFKNYYKNIYIKDRNKDLL